jgi:hypothetical protein
MTHRRHEITPKQFFFFFEAAWRTLQGFEVMNMIRKRQLQGVAICRTFDEGHQFFRFRHTIGQSVSLVQQRDVFCQQVNIFNTLVLRA